MAEDKKVKDSVILNLRKISNICDFFVILSGTSATHIRAIADGIIEGLSKEGVRKSHFEGYAQAKWIVLDYTSVIVHIFDEETRNFYALEHLWADASKILPKKEKK